MKWFRTPILCSKTLRLVMLLLCIAISGKIYIFVLKNFVVRYQIVPHVERVGDVQSFVEPASILHNIQVVQTSKKVVQTSKLRTQTPQKAVQAPKRGKKKPNRVVQTQTPKNATHAADNAANILKETYRNISKYFQLSKSDHRDPLLNLHQFNYLINSDKCQQNVFVVAFVHSSADHWQQRNQIRTTWGGYKGSRVQNFRTLFMLGKPTNRALQPVIEREAKKYNDMVQGDFDDSYKNLTYKHIMSHSWIIENCPDVRYILKVDDDIVVNVYNMMKYLNTHKKPMKNFLYCNALWYEGPHRNNQSKWSMTKSEYPFTKYPQFCEGFAYITTPDVSAKLVKVSEDAKFYWIDDVFVTGVLTLRAGIPLTSMAANHDYMRRSYTEHLIRNKMFFVDRTATTRHYWKGTWKAILKYSIR